MFDTTQETLTFYVKTIRDTVEGVLNVVCEANGIPRIPTSRNDLRPIPVYESEAKKSLLSVANDRTPTKILWPVTPQLYYLQAYCKLYRNDKGRVCNDIVICSTNYCWARFYAAKELMHCLVDEDGYSASNSVELVNDLLESLATQAFSRQENCKPQTGIDEMAWLGAMEFLLPTSWLPELAKLCNSLAAQFPQENPFLYVAQIMRVPELVLTHRLKHAPKG